MAHLVTLHHKDTGQSVTVTDAQARVLAKSGWVESTKDSVPIPRRSGAGSGREAWAAYAEVHHVPVDPAATRDDIIAALEAAGVDTSTPASGDTNPDPQEV